MGENRNWGADFIAIGENIHTTRVLRRKGKSIVEHEGLESICYNGPENDTRYLVIPDTFKERQEYRQGQIAQAICCRWPFLVLPEKPGL